MKAEALLMKNEERIINQIRQYDDRIEKIREKYPYELFGCRADARIDKIKDEQKKLEAHLDLTKKYDKMQFRYDQVRTENDQLRLALRDVLRQLSHYDPYTADTIKRRWRIE